MNIITYLCVDLDDKAKYDQLSYFNNTEKRLIYWRCVVTFFATSLRCNPDATHILYTNDKESIIDDGFEIRKFVESLGVVIKHLPFDSFKPPAKLSTRFTNAFYKYTVIEAVAKERTPSIILDNDCVWLRSYKSFSKILEQDVPVVYNPYDETDDPNEKNANGVSKNELGKFFCEVNPEFNIKHPTWYGGEFLAGNPKGIQELYNALKRNFEYIAANADASIKLTLKDNFTKKIFDGNEFIWSMVLNSIEHKVLDPEAFIKRVWTGVNGEISQPKIFQELVVWHLISEKTFGLPILYKEIIKEKSKFWKLPINQMPEYLGGFFGIPKRKVKIKHPNKMYVFYRKVIGKLKHMRYERQVKNL